MTITTFFSFLTKWAKVKAYLSFLFFFSRLDRCKELLNFSRREM